MTLSRNQEERVRRAFGVLVDTTPPGVEFEELASTSLAPSQRPRPSGWLVFTTAFLLVAVVGGFAVWANLGGQGDSDTATNLAPGEVVLLHKPLVVLGADSPEPLFDASQLGTEVVLSEPPDIRATIARIEDWLYPGGQVNEDNVIKYVVAGAISTGAEAGTLDTSSERGWGLWIVPPTEVRPMWAGRNDREPHPLIANHPGSDSPTEDDDLQGTFAWGPLSAETSVITASYGDTAVWQRPVGGIAVFDISNPEHHPIVWTAYDQDGNVIETVTDGGAEYPLASGDGWSITIWQEGPKICHRYSIANPGSGGHNCELPADFSIPRVLIADLAVDFQGGQLLGGEILGVVTEEADRLVVTFESGGTIEIEPQETTHLGYRGFGLPTFDDLGKPTTIEVFSGDVSLGVFTEDWELAPGT